MTIAVTGGTGRIGGRIVQLLTAAGRRDVTALSSRTAPYDRPDALRRALTGVDTLVLVSSDGEAARVLTHHHNIVQAAVACGTGHVVLLSGLDHDLGSPFCYAYTNGRTEQLLAEAGLPHSIVRAGLYTEFFLGLMDQVAVDGGVALPAADGRVSLVTRDDVARSMAALALREPADRAYDITGPESLPVADVAAAAGHRYHDCGPSDYAAALLRVDGEPWWTYAYLTMFAAIREHRWQSTSPAFTELTGRPATSLRQFLAATGPVPPR